MKKKIIYGIMILIIIAGAVMIGVMGLEADITYSKNVRLDIYIGKTFENEDIKQIVQEVFGNGRTIVQKVEYYGDMASVTIKEENAENIDEKLEQLNTKINEKYGVENKADEITVTHQPKMRLHTILMPYIVSLAISGIIILAYVMIRYRNIGILRTLTSYIVSILAVEALYLSIIAIARIPVNRLVVPIGLLIYVITATIVTAIQEKKYYQYQEQKDKK